MSKEALKQALGAAYLAGFNASGQGWNAEHPFQDYNEHPEKDAGWVQKRDKFVEQALSAQQGQVIGNTVFLSREELARLFPQPVEGCDFCNNPLYAGTVCKNCGQQPSPGLLQRAVDLYEKSGMPWMQAEKLALEEIGIGDAEIDEMIGNASHESTAITGLLSEEELRAFVRSILLYQHAPPPQRKPLRGERFVEIARAIAPRTVLGLQETIPVWIVKYGRAIEAAHGIKGDA